MIVTQDETNEPVQVQAIQDAQISCAAGLEKASGRKELVWRDSHLHVNADPAQHPYQLSFL